jgi:hypothetical protein
MLGSVKSGSQFIVDTEWIGGFAPSSPTKGNVIATAEESLMKLKMDKFRTAFSVHPLPRPTSSHQIALPYPPAGVNEAYKKDYFSHFGLSNYRV